MSHFAEINSDNIVQRVIVAEQDFINSGAVGDSFNWVQTSYNNNFRKNSADIGATYDKIRDAFIYQKPYPSWTLNEDTCRWEAPIEKPDDSSGEVYVWDEDNTEWKPMAE